MAIQLAPNEWLILAYMAPGLLVSLACAWYIVSSAFSREPGDGFAELGALFGCVLMPVCWPAFAMIWTVEWLMTRPWRSKPC